MQEEEEEEETGMSLVISPMKVVNVPMVSIKEHQVGIPVFIHGDKKEKLAVEENGKKTDMRGSNGYSFEEKEEDAEESSESSSIGVLSSSSSEDEEEGGDEVQSKLKDEGVLASLTSLEESLPIKRGLSNFFPGKSKSFANFLDAASSNARDLVKPENPFNKRRRILMSCTASWRRRASCTSLVTSFPALLSPDLVEEDEEDEEEEEEESGGDFPLVPLPSLRKSFKNPRSFSLSDLQKV